VTVPLVEFRSVVDAVRCAIEVQNGMVDRNVGLPQERRIEFRVGSFRFFAACAHALAGELEAGRSLAQEGLAMEPQFRLRFFFELLPRGTAERAVAS
jgi:hypothetical protein